MPLCEEAQWSTVLLCYILNTDSVRAAFEADRPGLLPPPGIHRRQWLIVDGDKSGVNGTTLLHEWWYAKYMPEYHYEPSTPSLTQ
jgi:hypothetical protein